MLAAMRRLTSVLAFALSVFVCASAWAHVERPAYWPDPAPDTSISPPAGGKAPKARSLKSALRKRAPGETRVVCQRNSMRLLKKSIRRARTRGYDDPAVRSPQAEP